MSSRSLADLRPDIAALAAKHGAACAAKGFPLLVYCTLRSNAEQAALYATGRTTPGAIVTNAKPGQSAHNPQADGLAVGYDCCPMRDGKPVWSCADPENAKLWELVGLCGESVGLKWSGRWTGHLREMAHFQAADFIG
jgi:peptidoglycan L-alanyl-D-glutamate endopeptidase CwlK